MNHSFLFHCIAQVLELPNGSTLIAILLT